MNCQPGLVGELLQLDLPEADAVAVTATAVGGDLQRTSGGVPLAAEVLPPGTNRRDRELGGLGRDPDIDEALVGSDVIDPDTGSPYRSPGWGSCGSRP